MTDRRYADREELQRMYVEQEMSMQEIADECDCSITTVHRYIHRYDIKARGHGYAARKPGLSYEMTSYGYMRWHGTRGDGGEKVDYGFTVHRLLAIAKYGPDAVTPDVDVHHKNGIRWDNRPNNIELQGHAEHASLHASDQEVNA